MTCASPDVLRPAQADLRNFCHEPLHEEGRARFNVSDDRFGRRTVVDRIFYGIVLGSGACVGPHDCVNQDILAVLALFGVDSHDAAHHQVFDENLVKLLKIVHYQPFFGVEIWTEKTVAKADKQWLEAVRYDEKKTDYRAEIERLFAKKPEIVFFTAYGTESKLILKQAYEMGLKPTKGWFADYMTMWSNEVIPESAEGIKGLVMGSTTAVRFPDYQSAYRKKYGADAKQTAFGAYAYDATWIAALAINMAGSTDTDKITKALYAASKIYNGVSGDKSFDKDGMQVTDYYQRRLYTGGNLVPIE